MIQHSFPVMTNMQRMCSCNDITCSFRQSYSRITFPVTKTAQHLSKIINRILVQVVVTNLELLSIYLVIAGKPTQEFVLK